MYLGSRLSKSNRSSLVNLYLGSTPVGLGPVVLRSSRSLRLHSVVLCIGSVAKVLPLFPERDGMYYIFMRSIWW